MGIPLRAIAAGEVGSRKKHEATRWTYDETD